MNKILKEINNMSNELELLDDDFVKIVKDIEKDILDTRYNIISKANKEVECVCP